MNPDGHIYRAPEDEIPAEDKARLDGYLLARAEQDTEARLKAKVAKLEAELLAVESRAALPSEEGS